jgi:hypothetical protein
VDPAQENLSEEHLVLIIQYIFQSDHRVPD